MQQLALTEIDLIVLVTVLISTLLSFLRGFLRDFLSFIAWIGAALITFLILPLVLPYLSEDVQSSRILTAFVVAGLYILILIIISIFNSMLLDVCREVRSGGIDRFLGIIFGFVRGALIVALAHYAITLTYAGHGDPDWLKKSETYPFTKKGADIIADSVDEHSDTLKRFFSINTADIDVMSLVEALVETDPGKRFKELGGTGPLRAVLKALPRDRVKALRQKYGHLEPETTVEEFAGAIREIMEEYEEALTSRKIEKEQKVPEERLKKLNEILKSPAFRNEEHSI